MDRTYKFSCEMGQIDAHSSTRPLELEASSSLKDFNPKNVVGFNGIINVTSTTAGRGVTLTFFGARVHCSFEDNQCREFKKVAARLGDLPLVLTHRGDAGYEPSFSRVSTVSEEGQLRVVQTVSGEPVSFLQSFTHSLTHSLARSP